MTHNDWVDLLQFSAAGAVIILGFGLGVVILRWFWRLSSRSGAAATQELEQVRTRLAELEADRGHMAELEERLDFAERLLARQAEIDRLAGGS